jgi:hypothetical protein
VLTAPELNASLTRRINVPADGTCAATFTERRLRYVPDFRAALSDKPPLFCRISGVENLEKVLEKLATSEKSTIVIQREQNGKMRVTSGSWDGEKVILKDQVLGVRDVDGRLHVARKPRKPDEWDPPIAPYNSYETGRPVTDDADFVSADDFVVTRNAARLLRVTRLSLGAFEPIEHKGLDRYFDGGDVLSVAG